jgi:hypothetical protein
MYGTPLRKIVGGLAGATGMLALVLSGVGTAAADEFNPPVDIQATGHYGECFSVTWEPNPGGEIITSFSVERPAYPQKTPAKRWGPLPPGQHDVWACEMEPGNTYEYEVCAYYGTDEGDNACAKADLQLVKTGNLEPGGPLPTPRVDEPIPSSLNNFGVGWKGFYDYDFYNINIRPEGGKLWSIKHDDDGNWGWQRVDGLTPGTTYYFSVQGCVSGIFGDPCSGWSPEAMVTIELPYGPDTCKPGFVWRDAVRGDHICVTPERRQKVADDFHTAKSRAPAPSDLCIYVEDPIACARGQGPCLEGFVPRDVPGENVIVCVDQKEADLIAQENANPNANRVQPR